MEQEVRIKISSSLYEVEESLFSFSPEEDVEELFIEDEVKENAEPSVLSINVTGKFSDDGERVSITYAEPEGSGMEGASTTVSLLKSAPDVITMTRTGFFAVTFVFEEGKRYHCVYNTPYAPFEVCVHTKTVINRIMTERKDISLDYIVEIRGAMAERTKFNIKVLF